MLQTEAVNALDSMREYQLLKKQTIKNRKNTDGAHAKFKEFRDPIRVSAAAARVAYARAAAAQPDTPVVYVTHMLEVCRFHHAPVVCCFASSPRTPHEQQNTWESVVALTTLLKDKGWFKSPPKKSMLRRDPACAWFTAGTHDNCERSPYLPSLHKVVLRDGLKRWLHVHFYYPVAGYNDEKEHVNIMEMFVAFVWGHYTQNQLPRVPAFTDVGRLTFTYIWRHQHALYRYLHVWR